MLEDEKHSEKNGEKKSKLSFWEHTVSKLKNHLFPTKSKLENKSRHSWISKSFELAAKYDLNPKLAILAVAILLSFFIFRDIADPQLDYRKGEIAQRLLIAKNTIEFIDKSTSEKKKQDLIDSVLSVYDFDQLSIVRIKEKIQNAFLNLRKKYPILTQRKSATYKKIIKNHSSVDLFYEAKESFSKDLDVEAKR